LLVNVLASTTRPYVRALGINQCLFINFLQLQVVYTEEDNPILDICPDSTVKTATHLHSENLQEIIFPNACRPQSIAKAVIKTGSVATTFF